MLDDDNMYEIQHYNKKTKRFEKLKNQTEDDVLNFILKKDKNKI